jgi:hypothetical protein
LRVALVGIGATAVMDLWLLLLKRFGLPGLHIAFIGRWVGHLARGTWRHDAIAKAAPVRHEALLGWVTHYAVGSAFRRRAGPAVGRGLGAQPLAARWGMAPRVRRIMDRMAAAD